MRRYIILWQRSLPRNINLDPDEFIEIYKFSLEECLEMIYNGTLVDSKAVVSILSYALSLK